MARALVDRLEARIAELDAEFADLDSLIAAADQVDESHGDLEFERDRVRAELRKREAELARAQSRPVRLHRLTMLAIARGDTERYAILRDELARETAKYQRPVRQARKSYLRAIRTAGYDGWRRDAAIASAGRTRQPRLPVRRVSGRRPLRRTVRRTARAPAGSDPASGSAPAHRRVADPLVFAIPAALLAAALVFLLAAEVAR